MKTGIYGGTFNPIHLGHLHICQEFIRRLGLDRVLLIPTQVPPHKEAEDLVSGEDRLAMCALAAQELGKSKIEICDLELQRPGKSYTADTLRELRARYPQDEFFLLMGEDMFLTIDQWYLPEEIFALSIPCASPRSADGYQKLLLKRDQLFTRYHARCVVENIPYFQASSTQVRELAARGEPLSPWVSEQVEGYILSHHLYDNYVPSEAECLKELEKHLSKKRRKHCLEVAKAAKELAIRYGCDPQKAYLAGLLHDILKEQPGEEQLRMLEKFGIILSAPVLRSPKLWHAIAGEVYCRQVLHVSDKEVLRAVRYHTSGRKDMTLLEKVLFIGDFISLDRDYPGVEALRKKAKQSLEETMVEAIAYTVSELLAEQAPVAVETVEAYNDALAACVAASDGK